MAMELWIAAAGVWGRFGMEMDHLGTSGELEDYILFWVNRPVLDFEREIFLAKHTFSVVMTGRMVDFIYAKHAREMSCLSPYLTTHKQETLGYIR